MRNQIGEEGLYMAKGQKSQAKGQRIAMREGGPMGAQGAVRMTYACRDHVRGTGRRELYR